MNLLDENGQDIENVNDFIEYWKNRYYRYTDVSDSIYHYALHEIQNNHNIQIAISLLGAWKTNAIRSGQFEMPAFICPCGAQYHFTGLWRIGTSSGYEVWTLLPDQFEEHMNRINNEPRELINELSNRTYNGPRSPQTRFGLSYSTAYAHFLNPEQFPILDTFAYRAIRFIFARPRPERPFRVSNNLRNYDDYFEQFVTPFNQLRNHGNAPARDMDKSLWTYGHFISRPIGNQVCCEQ